LDFFNFSLRETTGESNRGYPPFWLGGPPPENLEILDGRKCNMGIYLREMKLLIAQKCRFYFNELNGQPLHINEI
jgi:hypothetical protein